MIEYGRHNTAITCPGRQDVRISFWKEIIIMKGCAKFLNVLAAIVFWLMILVTVALAATAGVIAFMPENIPELPAEIGQAITINGSPLTTQMLLGYKNFILIGLGGVVFIFLLTVIFIAMIKRALKEVINDSPFSVRCSKALKTAGILEIVSGDFLHRSGDLRQLPAGRHNDQRLHQHQHQRKSDLYSHRRIPLHALGHR